MGADCLVLPVLLAAFALAPIIGGGFDESPTAVIELLMFISAVLFFARFKSVQIPRFAALVPLTLFCVLVCVSAFFGENIYAAIKSVLYLGSCFLTYCLAGKLCRSSRVASIVVWTFVLVAFGISLFGIRDYAIGTGGGAKFWRALVHGSEHWRLFGTFLNPSLFGGYLVVTIPVTLGAYLSSVHPIGCFVAGIGLVLQVSAILLTGTKFAAVALAIALLTMFVHIGIFRILGRRELVLFVLIFIALFPCILLFSAPLTERVREAESGGTQVHSTKFRVYVWRSTLQMIRDNPIVGLGPGTFEVAYPRYAIAGPTKHAHQSYLQIGAESGVPALLALLAAIIFVVRDCLCSLRSAGKRPIQLSGNDANVGLLDKWCAFRSWRLLNCAIFSAFVGSCLRNLVDSDWFVIGIALPVSGLVGVLSAQTSESRSVVNIGGRVRTGLMALTAVAGVLSVSIALGDYLAPDEDLRSYAERDVKAQCNRYRLAVLTNPLNPEFRREYSKCIALTASDLGAAEKQIAIAIRIAPTDAANYFTRGLLALFEDKPRQAIYWFRRALKYNPNSTQILHQLALTYRRLDDAKAYECVLKRLIQIENSDYERIRGVPELVDLNYTYAHMYFGDKYLAQGKYGKAVSEYKAVVTRIENWRSQRKTLKMLRALGMLTEGQERAILQNLYHAYWRLSKAYQLIGQPELAKSAQRKAESLKLW